MIGTNTCRESHHQISTMQSTKRTRMVEEDVADVGDCIVVAPPKPKKSRGDPPSRSPPKGKNRVLGPAPTTLTRPSSKKVVKPAEDDVDDIGDISPEIIILSDTPDVMQITSADTADEDDGEADLDLDVDYVDEEEAALAAVMDEGDWEDVDDEGECSLGDVVVEAPLPGTLSDVLHLYVIQRVFSN